MLWLALAAAITRRAAREHLPFSLTWWSFTFPVGTVVTGTSVLAASTHASFLKYASVALYALLVAAWLTAATRTARGTIDGRLFPNSMLTGATAAGRMPAAADARAT
jgi:tellurite resistance protein TehA-like permease